MHEKSGLLNLYYIWLPALLVQELLGHPPEEGNKFLLGLAECPGEYHTMTVLGIKGEVTLCGARILTKVLAALPAAANN